MDKKILVAYATKYGSTAEIARKIGGVLTNSGWDTDVLHAGRVRSLEAYGPVVLGSAVYIGKWRKEGKKFLEYHEKSLMERPVWIFSSGPTGEGEALELLKGWRLPSELQPVVDRIRPRDIAVFHGFVDTNKLNFLEKWMLTNVKAQSGDFRDWGAITAWATSIAEALR